MKFFISAIVMLLSIQISTAQANRCEEEVYSKSLLNLTHKVLNKTLNREDNPYQNPLSLVKYDAPLYCGVQAYGGAEYTLVSVKVTVDEYSTTGASSYRMKETCFISFRYVDGWVAEHITCDNQLNIDDELSISL